ncbi:MAG: ankyrin repeat domain-containing protein [Francisellaceae bacterium]|jgi:hypothetical protein|nr:ankyrin repeat domain-containing protein [Francisellaceae bacterium]MBT6538410.1 ankyrin repeat domain-containing protein [Francisellaceae bacterium]
MSFISEDKFTNPILKQIASGDESVFSGSPEDLDVEDVVHGQTWRPLSLASNNGHLDIVIRLLEIPEVAENAAARDNEALFCAAQNRHINVVKRLLDMPQVSDNAAVDDNFVLRFAARHSYISLVNRLLDIPQVAANATVADNIALRRAAQNGHINVVNRLLDIPRVAANAAARNNEALLLASINGLLSVVNRLLDIPRVAANAAADDNRVFRCSSRSGHISVVNRLLEIRQVAANAAARNNEALRVAAQNGHLNVINKLLEIPQVVGNAAARNNIALRSAVQNGHNEVAYVLAKLQWPRGVADMPDDLHGILPAIQREALLASGEKEAEGMVKCWVRGRPISSTSDIHYPSHEQGSHEVAARTPGVIFTNIMQHAGYRDVVEEAERESRAENVMKSLLYSRHLHKTFQAAYEKGRREREGYGEGAMVLYNPGNRNTP